MKAVLLALTAVFSVSITVVAEPHPIPAEFDRSLRRRHSRRSLGRRGTKCKPQQIPFGATSASADIAPTATASPVASGSTSQGSATDDPFSKNDFLAINGIAIGFLPDNGDSGGSPQDINELNTYIGHKSFAAGYYAHVTSEPFDGAELLDQGASQLMGNSGLDPGSVQKSSVNYQKDVVFNQIVESGSVFIASVMPLTWDGLTSDNNTQAVRIAQVMKRFTDAGVVTWLRFAHEANWYNSDSCTEAPGGGKVYQGGPSDIKEGWATMAAAIKQYAPLVKMYWSPNAGSQSEIEQYAPDDKSTIDIVGIDFYPGSADKAYLSNYQWLHDNYASETVPFTLGETGSTQDIASRQAMLQAFTSADTAQKMPYFKLLNWFNYNKGADFMLGGKACSDCQQTQVQSFFQNLA